MLEIPIFPLPDMVFFPKTLLPLHVFEPRYKEMVAHALGSGRLIGMVLLKPGWEPSYYEHPDAYEVGCLGRIQQIEEAEEGRYNIVLLGIHKFRILRYIKMEPFRIAEVQLLEDISPAENESQVIAEKSDLLTLTRQLSQRLPSEVLSDKTELSRLSYEGVVNNLAMSVNMDAEAKQQLLEMEQVRARGRAVAHQLRKQLETLEFFDRFRHLAAKDPTRN